MLLALLCGSPSLALPKIVVLEVKALDDESRKAASVLNESILTKLSRSGRYETIGQSDVAAMLGFERQKQLLGCSEEASSCLAELSGALGADYLLMGTVATLDRNFRVDLKIMDPSKGKVIAREGALAGSVSGVIVEAEAMVPRMLAVISPPGSAPDAGLEKSPGQSRVAPIALLAVGGGAVVGGALLINSALSFNERKDELTISEALRQRGQAEQLRNIGVAVAGAGVIAAGIGVLLFARGDSTQASTVSLSVAPSGAIVSVGGSF